MPRRHPNPGSRRVSSRRDHWHPRTPMAVKLLYVALMVAIVVMLAVAADAVLGLGLLS